MAKVLIVDDDHLVRLLVSNRLQSDGYEVFTGYSGESGFEAAKKEKPDVAIIDMKMPDMSGVELLKKMKSDEDTKKTVVIMLSGVAEDEEMDQVMELGAQDYIFKPFVAEDLVAKIRKAVNAD